MISLDIFIICTQDAFIFLNRILSYSSLFFKILLSIKYYLNSSNDILYYIYTSSSVLPVNAASLVKLLFGTYARISP